MSAILSPIISHQNAHILDWLGDIRGVLVVVPVEQVEESESGRESEPANLVDAPDARLPPDLKHRQVGSFLGGLFWVNQ